MYTLCYVVYGSYCEILKQNISTKNVECSLYYVFGENYLKPNIISVITHSFSLIDISLNKNIKNSILSGKFCISWETDARLFSEYCKMHTKEETIWEIVRKIADTELAQQDLAIIYYE